MKVILLEKYKKLGAVGDVVDVKNGFARNFLIPNGKATQATKSNVEHFESRKSELTAQSKKKEEAAQKLSAKIKDKIVNVVKQAGDDGRLYGAVNSSEIADGLNEMSGVELSRKQVILNYAIKFIGVYQIDIDLGEGVFGEVYLNVARSEGEAEENAKKFKSGEIQLTTVNTDLASKAVAVKPEVSKQEKPVETAKEEAPAAEAAAN
jgi:large subunit ribosomal protein L9